MSRKSQQILGRIFLLMLLLGGQLHDAAAATTVLRTGKLVDGTGKSITNAVVVIQGGRVLVERYAGVREFFDRPPEPITEASSLLSWSMAKSMLHFLVGTLVDEGQLDPAQLAPVPEWADPSGLIRVA